MDIHTTCPTCKSRLQDCPHTQGLWCPEHRTMFFADELMRINYIAETNRLRQTAPES